MKKVTEEELDFRHLFESAPALMLVLDPALHIVAVSDSYLEATFTKREEILGKYLFDVFPDNPEIDDPDGVSNLHSSLKRVLEFKKPDTMAVQRYDVRLPESEGGGFIEKYWSPLNAPVFDKDGTTLKYIIHRVKDATEFVKLKEQHKMNEDLIRRSELMEVEIYTRGQELQHAREILEEKNNELVRSNAEMESFSYSVSHDLRAPLRAIGGYAGMLEEDYGKMLDEEGRRLLGEVQKNSRKMGDLIDDLLALSRLGRKEMKVKMVDMTALAHEALREVCPDQESCEQVKISPLHDACADHSLIMHVMTNLLSNALKYSSHAKTPMVEVSSQRSDDEIIYTVRDNGVGFDMTYANKLFGVFQRLHSSSQFEGTGVGLAIVKRIVERHGGKVWAEGKINEGAEFSFSLPVLNDR